VPGKITKDFRKAISHRGGLSMGRLDTIDGLYQAVKSFFKRLTPDDCATEEKYKEKSDKKSALPKGFAKKITTVREHLKDNRIKQLVSRIVEAALGLGGGIDAKAEKEKLQQHNGKNTLLQLLDKKRDRKAPTNPRFKPCHAVVIEYLNSYTTDQERTRRENKRISRWTSALFAKRLADHCQLYGLFLMQVGAAYTSQTDSRTGMPGMRCVDVPITEFAEKGFFGKQAKKIQKKKESERTPTEQLLVVLADRCKGFSGKDQKKALRIPMKWGDLFVSADATNYGIQADLNAAVNIGLKALTKEYWRNNVLSGLAESPEAMPKSQTKDYRRKIKEIVEKKVCDKLKKFNEKIIDKLKKTLDGEETPL